MRALAIAALLLANSALAHEGHGALAGHLHWLDYGLLAGVMVIVALYRARKKR